jgi:hypothetical protein
VRELPDGDAVVAAAAGETAVIVNASGHAILELLGEGKTSAEIASFLRELFPAADAAQIQRDVTELMDELSGAGLVEPCGAESSTA